MIAMSERIKEGAIPTETFCGGRAFENATDCLKQDRGTDGGVGIRILVPKQKGNNAEQENRPLLTIASDRIIQESRKETRKEISAAV